MRVKLSCLALMTLFAVGNAFAETPSCDSLKDTAVTKKGKKVSPSLLKVVDAKAKVKGKLIGLCDGGQKKVIKVRKAKSAKTKS